VKGKNKASRDKTKKRVVKQSTRPTPVLKEWQQLQKGKHHARTTLAVDPIDALPLVVHSAVLTPVHRRPCHSRGSGMVIFGQAMASAASCSIRRRSSPPFADTLRRGATKARYADPVLPTYVTSRWDGQDFYRFQPTEVMPLPLSQLFQLRWYLALSTANMGAPPSSFHITGTRGV
jgi:hypothetical protein